MTGADTSRVLAIVLMALVPQPCRPEPASDAQMAAEAMNPYVPDDPRQKEELLQSHYRKIVELAAQAPDEIRPATVFFTRGLTVRELHELHVNLGVEVIDAVMKAPEGNNGVVMSILGGMGDMFAIDGTLEERLSFLIASEQKCFARMSQHMSPDEAKVFVELASRPFHVYSARIFGPSHSLKELLAQPGVAGVLLNLRDSVISDFEAARSYDGPHRYLMPGFAC